jgi:hypothetical protein
MTERLVKVKPVFFILQESGDFFSGVPGGTENNYLERPGIFS